MAKVTNIYKTPKTLWCVTMIETVTLWFEIRQIDIKSAIIIAKAILEQIHQITGNMFKILSTLL